MTGSRAQRRLAAILVADVSGYSRMMAADEVGTLAVLRDLWARYLNPILAVHQGRVVKMMGDGALVEFASAVDAVECALAIQAAMAAYNVNHKGRAPVELRMGVNLGGIVIEGDDIFGDGVNVAARLEAQAPKAGILISDSVHAMIRGKVGAEFTDAGELSLKNIAAPVRAWRWGGDNTQAAASETVLQALDASPSIAVLPFNNMSGDPEQEYFSDGITEDIITDLSKVSGLLVIARNSSFAYKGKAPDIRAVGRELGVTSVLEGSIRRAGNRVRITAQLIDATTGGHLWAERYDRDLTDIFALQDEVTLQIVNALKVTLRPAEKALLAVTRVVNVEAHDCFLRGRELLFGATKNREVFERTITLLKRAIELDPDYAEPYAGLAMAYCFDFQNKWANTPNALKLAAQYSVTAVKKDPNNPFSHVVASVIALWQRHLETALTSAERALVLNPNDALAVNAKASVEIYMGNPLAAIPYLERALRLDPVHAQQAIHFLGFAYLVAGHYEAAAEQFQERIRLAPNTDFSRAFLASALGHLGKIGEAQQVWRELMEINPDYSFAAHLARQPFRNPEDGNRIVEGLARAGLIL